MNTSVKEEVARRFLLQEEYLGDDKPVNKITPLVSVTVATYRHAPYIRACLDGILMQKVDFPYEIIVGEDESNDGTREVCKEYARRHPDRIRLFLRDRNISHYKPDDKTMGFNGFFTLMSVRGKYTAICEGDDYWTDSSKLQRQIKVLEFDNAYSLCFHNATILFQDRTKDSLTYCPSFLKDFSTYCTNDLIESIVRIPTNTMVFRSDMLLDLPSWFYTTRAGEKALQLFASLYGRIVYLDRIMSVYRVHQGGFSYNQSQKYASEVMSELYNNFDQSTDYEYNEAISKRLKHIRDDYDVYNLRTQYGRLLYLMKPQYLIRRILNKIQRKMSIASLSKNDRHSYYFTSVRNNP